MKKFLGILVLGLLLSFPINASALDFMPANPPVPAEVVYKGVTEEQWKIIDKIGDPLNCRKQVYDLQNISIDDYFQITTDDCLNNENCIEDALSKHDQVMLRKGVYKLPDKRSGIFLSNQKLIGYPGETIIINAEEAMTAFEISNSILSNLIIQNSKNIGIAFSSNNLVYRVVVGNTGVYFKNSVRGIGFNQTRGVENNCIVSAEAYNGYNYIAGYKAGMKGGSADGFDVKHGAGNATFIDAHGHHNSDHGFDFVYGGKPASISPDPNIRVFYSSANYGRNFFKGGGDKSGFKIDDHVEQAERSGKDVRTRLIYGSVACRNPQIGFTKPGKTKLIFIGNQSSGNKVNAKTGSNYHRKVPLSASPFKNKKVNDPYILKCKDFKKVKKFRSFDIPIDLK